jgi:mevalonate kinase
MVSVSAPAKVILLGEHAVVYGRPAIAVPVSQLCATAEITPGPPGSGLIVVSADLGQRVSVEKAAADDPLAAIARLALTHLKASPPDAVLTLTSTIPIAGGMGSGTAVSTAIVRALAAFLGRELAPAEVSKLVYQVEKLHHGTPSGIDNTVVAYERPVYFVKDHRLITLSVGAPLHLLVADSGIASRTREVVADVCAGWEAQPVRFDFLFDQIADLVEEAREAIEEGDPYLLGSLMDQNHEHLRELQVSCPKLDEMVDAARFGGALGAKLSGAGRGGSVIALVDEPAARDVEEALEEAGATWVIAVNLE